MGSSYRATCRACGNRFVADSGGGRRFEELRCSVCGAAKAVAHNQVPEAVQNLKQALEALDLDDEAGYDRVVGEYHQNLEAFAGACACGGSFCFGAPLRCPACKSTDLDLGKPFRLYD